MFLMSPVDGYTFLAVAVVAAGFLARAVILVLIFFPECGGKLLLKPQSFGAVATVKGIPP